MKPSTFIVALSQSPTAVSFFSQRTRKTFSTTPRELPRYFTPGNIEPFLREWFPTGAALMRVQCGITLGENAALLQTLCHSIPQHDLPLPHWMALHMNRHPRIVLSRPLQSVDDALAFFRMKRHSDMTNQSSDSEEAVRVVEMFERTLDVPGCPLMTFVVLQYRCSIRQNIYNVTLYNSATKNLTELSASSEATVILELSKTLKNWLFCQRTTIVLVGITPKDVTIAKAVAIMIPLGVMITPEEAVKMGLSVPPVGLGPEGLWEEHWTDPAQTLMAALAERLGKRIPSGVGGTAFPAYLEPLAAGPPFAAPLELPVEGATTNTHQHPSRISILPSDKDVHGTPPTDADLLVGQNLLKSLPKTWTGHRGFHGRLWCLTTVRDMLAPLLSPDHTSFTSLDFGNQYQAALQSGQWDTVQRRMRLIWLSRVAEDQREKLFDMAALNYDLKSCKEELALLVEKQRQIQNEQEGEERVPPVIQRDPKKLLLSARHVLCVAVKYLYDRDSEGASDYVLYNVAEKRILNNKEKFNVQDKKWLIFGMHTSVQNETALKQLDPQQFDNASVVFCDAAAVLQRLLSEQKVDRIQPLQANQSSRKDLMEECVALADLFHKIGGKKGLMDLPEAFRLRHVPKERSSESLLPAFLPNSPEGKRQAELLQKIESLTNPAQRLKAWIKNPVVERSESLISCELKKSLHSIASSTSLGDPTIVQNSLHTFRPDLQRASQSTPVRYMGEVKLPLSGRRLVLREEQYIPPSDRVEGGFTFSKDQYTQFPIDALVEDLFADVASVLVEKACEVEECSLVELDVKQCMLVFHVVSNATANRIVNKLTEFLKSHQLLLNGFNISCT